MSAAGGAPTPSVRPAALAEAAGSTDPLVAQWAASRAALDGTDLPAALAASARAGHATRDRVLDRIARAGLQDLGPAIRALADPAETCGVPVRTLLGLRDPEAVALAARWLAQRTAEDAEDVGTVVHSLLAEGSPEAITEARRVRDSRVFDSHAPLALPFALLATTGDPDDAGAAVTAWLQTPPAAWQGEDAACALLAECGLSAVPATWFGVGRRVPEFFRVLAEATDTPLDACWPGDERRELVRHWQKRHWQEVVTRLRKATRAEGLPPALQALGGALQARQVALSRMDADDAGDLCAVLVGIAGVSRATTPATDLTPDALAAELARPLRRIDPRATRALMERAAALGDAVVPALAGLIDAAPGHPGAGLAVAALLRCTGSARLAPLWRASNMPLPATLLSATLEALAEAGPDALPLLREALGDPAAAPPVPTPGIMALAEGAAYAETVALLVPLLPRWLARAKQRTLALCAVLAHPDLLPPLVDDWVAGEHHEADVIRLIATLHGDAETAARFPATTPEPRGLVRGPDGRPMLPPMRLLLRCVDCTHGYYYEVRQVRITNPEARFVESDGPPGPPEGIELPEPVTCKRCGAVDRYRFTLEAVQAVRDAMQAEMYIAMQEQLRAEQRAALEAGRAGPGNEPPTRRSPGGIILP